MKEKKGINQIPIDIRVYLSEKFLNSQDIERNNFFEESRSSSVVMNDERGEKIT